MYPKLLIFVLAGFLAVQVSADPESKLDTPFDNAIYIIKHVLEVIHNLINLAFQNTEITLNKLLGQLDDFRAGAMNLVDKEIQRESKLLYKLIEAVKNRSSGTNLDILNCLQAIESEAGSVEKVTVNTSIVCIDTSIEATGKNILYILEDLRQINTDFETHEAQLDKCKGQMFPVGCIKGVIDELAKVALAIPGKIKTDTEKATMDFAALGYEIFQCAKEATQGMQEANLKLFNEFSQCVYDKEHPNP